MHDFSLLLTRLGHRRISLLLPDAHNWSLLTRRPPEVLEKDLAGLALRDKAEVRFKAVPRTLCFDATLDCMAECVLLKRDKDEDVKVEKVVRVTEGLRLAIPRKISSRDFSCLVRVAYLPLTTSPRTFPALPPTSSLQALISVEQIERTLWILTHLDAVIRRFALDPDTLLDFPASLTPAMDPHMSSLRTVADVLLHISN